MLDIRAETNNRNHYEDRVEKVEKIVENLLKTISHSAGVKNFEFRMTEMAGESNKNNTLPQVVCLTIYKTKINQDEIINIEKFNSQLKETDKALTELKKKCMIEDYLVEYEDDILQICLKSYRQKIDGDNFPIFKTR